MKKLILAAGAVAAICVAIFGLPPFTGQPTPGFAEGEAGFETGVRRLPNGVNEVSALTQMPGVSSEMVGWWFGTYLQTTEHYKRWFPAAHVWMDWENKTPDEYIGASHLVHEYIGEDLAKLRIQFVPVEQVLGEVDLREDDVAVCALVGLLEEPLYGGKMCHIIRNVEGGQKCAAVSGWGLLRNGMEMNQCHLYRVSSRTHTLHDYLFRRTPLPSL